MVTVKHGSEDLYDLVLEHLEVCGTSASLLKQLRDELRDANSRSMLSSRLHKVFQYAKIGSVEVHVVPLEGQVCAVQASAATTVRDLKVMIEAQSAIPWAQQQLIHDKCVLQDDQCLATYNITPYRSTVTLHITNPGSKPFVPTSSHDFPIMKPNFQEQMRNQELRKQQHEADFQRLKQVHQQQLQQVEDEKQRALQDVAPQSVPTAWAARDMDVTAVPEGNGDEDFLSAPVQTNGNEQPLQVTKPSQLNGHLFGLKSLEPTEGKVFYDANRFEQHRQDLKCHQDDIYEKINHMRQTLRGKFVAMVPLLSDDVLNAEERATLVGKLRPWNHPAGTVLVEEGAVGDELFIVEHGSCAVYRMVEGEQIKVKQLGPGEFFGELAVIYDVLRAATVVTESLSTVLTLSRKDLFSVIRSKEQRHRLQVVARAGFLQDIPFFQSTKLPEKVTIAKSLQERHWQAGEVIIRQGSIVKC
eukprot:gnl/MRDRNA2_/MRDRNA2_18268_c0_seq1.p1 gnl/MRDRNA2_/MRDRNA2_18268_c0~~gnl/MRDRNA2_/MRDRNA2_18268_c0_seq1.p1  ORF type:complete len:471 (-),score=105.04 gnl/MRDRNA2_/MRDRNA2_18268_c0_seq1:15-1427(-)